MKYVCQICGYVYDDDKQKVPFEQLPDDWKCPQRQNRILRQKSLSFR